MVPPIKFSEVDRMVYDQADNLAELLWSRMCESPGAVGWSVSVWLKVDAAGTFTVEVSDVK